MKIYCLEGEWDHKITDRQSVEPLLELLRDVERVDYVHRRVGTRHELVRQASKWRRYPSYSTLYLASHGRSGVMWLSGDEGPLYIDELGKLLADSCHDGFVLLSGCQTMLAPDHLLRGFLERTGAAAVCGYRILVNWIRAAALDLLLLQALAEDSERQRQLRGVTLLRRFHHANAALVRATGFDWFVAEGRGRDLVNGHH